MSWQRYVHVDCGGHAFDYLGKVALGAPLDRMRIRWPDGTRAHFWDRPTCRACGRAFDYSRLRRVPKWWERLLEMFHVKRGVR